MKRRGLIAVVATTALLLVGGWLFAGAGTDDYMKSWDAWAKKEQPRFAKVTTLPPGVYVTGDPTTKAALAKQERGCDAVASQRKDLTTLAEDAPTFSGGPLGFLRNDRVRVDSERRVQAVEEFVADAEKALRQIETDCRWNIALNTKTTVEDRFFDAAKKYVLKPGFSTRFATGPNTYTTITCPRTSEQGCMHTDPAKRKKENNLRIKAWQTYLDVRAPLFKSNECAATSYTKAYCAGLHARDRAVAEAELRHWRWRNTIKGAGDGAGVEARNAALSDKRDAEDKELEALFREEHPDIAADRRMKGNEQWTDMFFLISAEKLLDRLKVPDLS